MKTIGQHLSVDDVSIILACLEDVTITDARAEQEDLRRRLCRALKKKAPEHYQQLLELGKFTDMSEAPKRTAIEATVEGPNATTKLFVV